MTPGVELQTLVYSLASHRHSAAQHVVRLQLYAVNFTDHAYGHKYAAAQRAA